MKFYIVLFFLCICGLANAQKEERKNIREGNKLYEEQKYKEAEDAYQKALEVNSKSVEGYYNTGNALYRQLKPEMNKQISETDKKMMNDAINNFKAVTSLSSDKKQKAMAWHNIGNIFMLSGNYEQSVEAYKNSLLNNSTDHDTRYNYVLAKELLKKQQQDQDKNKDKNQDKQQQQQQQNQDNKEKEQDNNQNKEQQQQNENMSKENAQQILDAMMQDERQTQEKVQNAKRRQQERRQPEKDW